MKEAIGSYFLTAIVVVMVLLFTGYLCLSINMNKAYKVKNEIINIIQKNNGFDEETKRQIKEYVTSIGYRSMGTCQTKDGDGYDANLNQTTDNAIFCVKTMYTEYTTKNHTEEQFPDTAYYQVKAFFAIDLPIVRKVFNFGIKGSTKKIFYPVEYGNNRR